MNPLAVWLVMTLWSSLVYQWWGTLNASAKPLSKSLKVSPVFGRTVGTLVLTVLPTSTSPQLFKGTGSLGFSSVILSLSSK